MSDLFGNHIVGFPTRRLNCHILTPQVIRFIPENVSVPYIVMPVGPVLCL